MGKKGRSTATYGAGPAGAGEIEHPGHGKPGKAAARKSGNIDRSMFPGADSKMMSGGKSSKGGSGHY
jgi:hypothetical protein